MAAEIVEEQLWDHYSELPNPAWYEFKKTKNMNIRIHFDTLKDIQLSLGDFEIGTPRYPEEALSLRFGYWEARDLERLNEILPHHIAAKEVLVDEDEYGKELLHYIIKSV